MLLPASSSASVCPSPLLPGGSWPGLWHPRLVPLPQCPVQVAVPDPETVRDPLERLKVGPVLSAPRCRLEPEYAELPKLSKGPNTRTSITVLASFRLPNSKDGASHRVPDATKDAQDVMPHHFYLMIFISSPPVRYPRAVTALCVVSNSSRSSAPSSSASYFLLQWRTKSASNFTAIPSQPRSFLIEIASPAIQPKAIVLVYGRRRSVMWMHVRLSIVGCQPAGTRAPAAPPSSSSPWSCSSRTWASIASVIASSAPRALCDHRGPLGVVAHPRAP